ncbi:hypothetical protein [Frondihabitans sp. PhB188]|uniref:hypothetical protein n=1 Tax=Frondihabitans sp. PhB188 TaxID=2485200 RepID=UPI000F475D96|nr:hypothetical protein [Frondihabitans sp. PhB188]
MLVVGGAITATTLRTSVYGPGPVAEAYLGDLSRGDATAAAKLEGSAKASGGMMTDAVLSKASARITDVAIGKVTTSGDIATVAAAFSVGGKQQDAILQLTRTGTSWFFKDEWKVKPLTSTVDVRADTIFATSDVTAGGTAVGALSDSGLELTAYPGVYDLSIAGTDYFGSTVQKIAVGAGSSSYGASAQFEAKPTDRLTTDAEKIVTDLIDTCEKSTRGDLDSDCPFYGPGSGYTKVSYKVTKQPTLAVSLNGDSISVTSEGGSGSVTEKYTDEFLGTSYPYSYDTTFNVYVSLKVVDGKLVVDDSY